MDNGLPPWLVKWWRSSDTGRSSRFMAAAYSGSDALFQVTEPAAPRDTSDVGRCVRLLDLAAANGCDWRAAIPMGRLGLVCREWAPLIPRWADIEAAYLEDVQVQKAWQASLYRGPTGSKRQTKRTDIPCPPSRCWWLVATLRPGGYDPYDRVVPHPFVVTP